MEIVYILTFGALFCGSLVGVLALNFSSSARARRVIAVCSLVAFINVSILIFQAKYLNVGELSSLSTFHGNEIYSAMITVTSSTGFIFVYCVVFFLLFGFGNFRESRRF